MGLTYTIRDQKGQYFITCTVTQWIDVFTRNIYKDILLDSIIFCQKNKCLKVYAWVLMTNHLLMIVADGKITFCQEGYHGEEITSKSFFDIKANYIHQNPVKAGIVEKEEEYLYSSCGDYYGTKKGFLDITFE